MLDPFVSKLVWIIANVAGATTFLMLASQSWIEPELANIPGASGGAAFGWFGTAVPLFAVFAIGHLVIGYNAVKSLVTMRQWVWLPALSCTVVIWMWTLWFDNLHHGI